MHQCHPSLLHNIKADVLLTIKQQSLTSTQELALENSMIEGTDTQKDLVGFKRKHCYTSGKQDVDKVGIGYWNGFMKWNASQIRYKRGQKYELDRALWITYANFHDMHTHNHTEMVKAGVAKLLNNPEW